MTFSTPFPSDPSQEVRLQVHQLTPVIEQILVKKSMFQFDASVAAKRMIEADLFGIPSHGVARIGEYVAAIDLGDIDPRARVLLLDETDVITVLDGSRAIGHVAATKAMESAIAKAKSAGVGVVALGNSQTLGAASVYVRLAVEQGVMAICVSSTGGATVAAPGTLAGAVGNAAFAYGVPVQDRPPLVFDAACGAESWGKLQLLERYGLPLPAGIALTETGEAAESVSVAKVLRAACGELGFGLSLLCSILAGPLSIGRMPINKTRSESAEDSQHFFIALDIGHFVAPEKFQQNLVNGLDAILALPPCDEKHPVRLPGERGWKCREHYLEQGIPFQTSLVEELRELARGLSVEVDWS